jgi:hypothetical protein
MSNTKHCLFCKESKDINQFSRDKSSKDKLYKYCRDCCKLYKRKWRENYRDSIRKYNKEYNQTHRDHKNEYYRKYRKEDKYRCGENERRRLRRLNDSNYKILSNLRSRFREVVKLSGSKKIDKTIKLLGCSIDFLKQHLQETAIKNGYQTFDINNYSGKEYHIDHIKPCASFDLTKPEEQLKCFNWSNLQILTAEENIQKSNKENKMKPFREYLQERLLTESKTADVHLDMQDYVEKLLDKKMPKDKIADMLTVKFKKFFKELGDEKAILKHAKQLVAEFIKEIKEEEKEEKKAEKTKKESADLKSM